MQKLLDILRAFALGGVSLLALALVVFVLQLSASVDRVRSDASNTFANLNDTLDHINRPCGSVAKYGEEPCGTLAQAGKVLANTHDLIIQSQMVESKESKVLDTSIPLLVGDAHSTITNLESLTPLLAGLVVSAQNATDDLHPLLLHANDSLGDVHALTDHLDVAIDDFDGATYKTFGNIDTLLANPDIPRTLKNGADITGTASHMLITADAVETKATYPYLHPSSNPFKRVWQTASPFFLPAAQVAAATVR